MTTKETLAELLEAFDLTKETMKELQMAENEASANPENEEAALRVKELRDKMEHRLEAEEETRGMVIRHLRNDTNVNPDPRDAVVGQVPAPTVTQDRSSSLSFNFKLPSPTRFQRDQNFTKFCEKFLDYITLSRTQDDNLNILFLNLLDDFTQEKLRKVVLTPDQRKDARKFIEVYERKMSPSHGGRTFRTKLAELRQGADEKAEDFAFRIADTASRAYNESEQVLREEACFTTYMKGLSDQEQRLKLHENTSITTFDEAVEEASRLENLAAALKIKSQTTEETLDNLEILHVREEGGRDYHHGQPGRRENETRRPRESAPGRRTTGREHQSTSTNQGTSGTHPQRGSADGSNPRGQRNVQSPILCYNCQLPNHLARNCLAPLN